MVAACWFAGIQPCIVLRFELAPKNLVVGALETNYHHAEVLLIVGDGVIWAEPGFIGSIACAWMIFFVLSQESRRSKWFGLGRLF